MKQILQENDLSILNMNFIFNKETEEVRCNVSVNKDLIPKTKFYRLNYLIKDFANKLNYL